MYQKFYSIIQERGYKINDYSIDDADGQQHTVSVETRLANYSVVKKGFYEQTTFIDSCNTTDHSFTLNKEVSTNYDFSNISSISGETTTLKSILKKSYDFSISKNYKLNDSFQISNEQKEASLQIYTLNRTYDYQLWESDLSHDIPSDSYLGSGTIKRPIGVIIAVTTNH